MLLRFFKVESAVIEMIMFFGFRSSVSTAVNERGEGTVVAVRAYLFLCPSFPFYDCIPNMSEKETGFSVSKQSQAPK